VGKISVFEILFGQCGASADNASRRDIIHEAPHFPRHIHAEMRVVSLIFYLNNGGNKRNIQIIRVGDRIAVASSLLG